MNSVWTLYASFYLRLLLSLQVQSAGEIALYAGLATIATFGFVALAGALLGDSKKETKNTKRF